MSRLNVLQGYISSSARILDALSTQGIVASGDADSINTHAASALDLAEHCDWDSGLRLELLSRPLGEPLVDEICKVYQEQLVRWKRELQAEWTTLQTTQSPRLEMKVATRNLLRNAYTANYSRGLLAMRMEILSVIDERLSQYHRDSEAETSALSNDHSTDTDDDNVRGHRAEAVAILEAAYAYTTNITQAEKRRLAQATGLEPRQVVIWFQNRRNRKVKCRAETAVNGTGHKQASLSVGSPRKRKVSCNDEAGPRLPSTLVTPEKKIRLQDVPPPPVDQRLFSSTSTVSMGSSVDSRADSLLEEWAGSKRNGKQRTASSESAATSYTSPSVISSLAATPTSQDSGKSKANVQASQIPAYDHTVSTSNRSKQEQAFAQHLLGTSTTYVYRQPPPIDIAHIFTGEQQYVSSSGSWGSPASSFLFSETSDVPRLDFDDLGFDLANFGKEALLPFDFAAPPPAGVAHLWQAGAAASGTPAGPMLNQDMLPLMSAGALKYSPDPDARLQKQSDTEPHHSADVAEALNDGDFDLFASLASLPTFQGMSPEAIVRFAVSGGQDSSDEAERTQYAQTPSSFGFSTNSSTSREKAVITPPSRVAEANSPEDFAFTFDFAELGLDRTLQEIRQSYRLADEEAKMYCISEAEDEEGDGATTGWRTGSEELQGQESNTSSCGTIVLERSTSSGIASGTWAIPARPVNLHGQRQAGARLFAS